MPDPSPSRAPSRRALLALPLLLLLALSACSGTSVQVQQPVADLTGFRTYAWSPPPAAEGTTVDADLAADLRAAVEAELAARGLRAASKLDADLFVRADVRVEVRVASRHAYNTGFYTADRFEDGVIAVRFVDADSKSLAWEGTAKRRLRRSDQGYGLYELKWVETGEARDWKVAETIGSVFDRLPLARVASD